MDDRYAVGQGATSPALTLALTDIDDTVVPLVGATARLKVYDLNLQAVIVDAAMTVSDAPNGVVTYTPTATDTANAGDFLARVEVTFADGSLVAFPDGAYFDFIVTPALTTGVFPSPAGTSSADLVAETRQYLDGPTREVLALLAAPIDANQTALSLSQVVSDPAAGDILTIGLESMYVWSFANGTATVQRGWDGSPNTAHSANTLVRVNPQWTDWRIFNAMNRTIQSLNGDLWQPKTLVRPVNIYPALVGYNLADDIVNDRILAVDYQAYITGEWRPVRTWRVDLTADKSVYPSGRAIYFPQSAGIYTKNLRITYRAGLTQLNSLAEDVVASTGLPPTALDLLPLGAAIRLMSGAPVQRVSMLGQGQTRRATEVRAGEVLQAPGALRAEYAKRLGDEMLQLNGGWAIRKKSPW